jgi:hypothetical protein
MNRERSEAIQEVALKCTIALVGSVRTKIHATSARSNNAQLVPSQDSNYVFLDSTPTTTVTLARLHVQFAPRWRAVRNSSF